MIGGEAAAAAPGTAPAAARLELPSLLLALSAPLAVGLIAWRRWYRLPAAPAVTPVSPALGLGLFLTMFALGLVGVAIARRLVLGDMPPESIADLPLADHARILMGHAIGQTAGAVIFFSLCPRAAMPGRRAVPIAILTGFATLVLLWPIVSGTSMVSAYVAGLLRGQPVDVIAHETLKELAESPAGPWLAVMSILVVFVAPVLEEVLYRGILQRTMTSLDMGRWTSIVITSVVFVTMHLGAASGHALPPLFVLSLGFGWAYERTGRLAAPITMHVLFNAANLALAWATMEP